MNDKHKDVKRMIDLAPDPVSPAGAGFKERVTPIEPKEEDGVFFFKCTSEKLSKICGGVHYRHAGYIQTMIPFMRSGGERRIGIEDKRLWVCVKCRACYVWINEQMYDVTDKVDLEAWEKMEKKLHKATGPGGQC